MQHSMILFVDRGLSFPWKRYFPLAKKALLAFLMFESIQVEQDRSGVHHASRQWAVFVTGIQVSPPDNEGGAFLGMGEMTASHFSTLSLRPLLEAKSATLDM